MSSPKYRRIYALASGVSARSLLARRRFSRATTRQRAIAALPILAVLLLTWRGLLLSSRSMVPPIRLSEDVAEDELIQLHSQHNDATSRQLSPVDPPDANLSAAHSPLRETISNNHSAVGAHFVQQADDQSTRAVSALAHDALEEEPLIDKIALSTLDQTRTVRPPSTGDSNALTQTTTTAHDASVSKISSPAAPLPPISVLVLFHAEYPTLNHTLETWETHGLVDLVPEFIFFLNGIASRDEFDSRLPRLRQPAWEGRTRVIPSTVNHPLGIAIIEMVRLAKHGYVLLLEKDWALIEPKPVVTAQLSTAASLIKTGTAHLARFRHRARPGAPLHARIMHQAREQQMLSQQPNLYCFAHHWVSNMTSFSQHFWQCHGSLPQEKVWCAKAKYCQWTNNPAMFKREWFLNNLATPFESDYKATKERGPNSSMLDFEFYMNWKASVWNDRDFVVALPVGLFEHQEIGEQNLMNTVWYAWSRLSTDVEEKRDAYFDTERSQCSSPTKSHGAGPTYASKYPLDFVRLYHYDRAMNRTLSDALSELSTEVNNVVRRLEDGHGTWRHGITDLTNLWYKVVLYVYPVEPKDMRTAFVTSFYPVEGVNMTEAVQVLARNVNELKDYPMVVYSEARGAQSLRDALQSEHGWSEERLGGVQMVEEGRTVMLKRVLSEVVVNRVDKLTTEKTWLERAAKRNGGKAPSGEWVKQVLVKPLLLRDVERMTSRIKVEVGQKRGGAADATHFVWVDAESRCVANGRAGSLSPNNDHGLRGRMLLNTVVSGARTTSEAEMLALLGNSGFDEDVLFRETGEQKPNGLTIVDGRTIGGSRLAITLMAGYYEVVMRDMLRSGQVGSQREPLTIARQNVEYNFEMVDGWSLCGGGRTCAPGLSLDAGVVTEDSEGGCRLFDWARACAVHGGTTSRTQP